jgi:molybdopterin molybdotransferase
VLAEEFAEAHPDRIEARANAEPGRNILFKKTEIAEGQTLVKAGGVISPGKVGLTVAGGHHRVSVVRRPVVGLLAAGNEILLPGRVPETGKLFASNIALQDAWLRSRSIKTIVGQAGDSFRELATAVESMLRECDMLLTSGGAWKGDRDLIVKVLDSLGWRRVFHRVRLGPGKAVGMGFLGGKPVFCLPGGPPSNEVAFLMFALPAALRMAGYRGNPYPRLTGILDKELGGDKDWTQAVHCRVYTQAGTVRLKPLDVRQRLGVMARADGLVLVREGVESIPAGASVEFIPLTGNHMDEWTDAAEEEPG